MDLWVAMVLGRHKWHEPLAMSFSPNRGQRRLNNNQYIYIGPNMGLELAVYDLRSSRFPPKKATETS